MPASTRADVLLVNGDLPDYTSFITGADAVVQRIKFRLLLHEGEWAADVRKGLPWKTWVQTKPAPLPIIHARVKETIKSTPGVAQVLHSTIHFEPATRQISMKVQAEIERSTVELEYLLSQGEYGNVSPYITYRVLGRIV